MSEVICNEHGWYGGKNTCPICDLYDPDKMEYHGCTTGDCPHEKQSECDDTLIEVKKELFNDLVNELSEIRSDMILEGPDEAACHRIDYLLKRAKASL